MLLLASQASWPRSPHCDNYLQQTWSAQKLNTENKINHVYPHIINCKIYNTLFLGKRVKGDFFGWNLQYTFEEGMQFKEAGSIVSLCTINKTSKFIKSNISFLRQTIIFYCSSPTLGFCNVFHRKWTWSILIFHFHHLKYSMCHYYPIHI